MKTNKLCHLLQDTLKNFEVFASSHELTKPTKRSRIFLSPRKVSPLLVPIFKSTESCATPNNKTQSKSKVDSQKTICQITTEVNSKQALHPRRVRRIKRDFDGTPMAGRLRKDTESQSTPVAASNFAAKPKNIMDVAEEDPATLNDSLIDCEFLVPSNFPTKQRRINFDDIDTNDESDDEREALFGSVFKFPSWTQSHKLHASIKRQSYVDRRGKVRRSS